MAETMRDRYCKFMGERTVHPSDVFSAAVITDDVVAFVESELRRAQQPAVPSGHEQAMRRALGWLESKAINGADFAIKQATNAIKEALAESPEAQPATPSYVTEGEARAHHAALREPSTEDLRRAEAALDKAGVEFVGTAAPSAALDTAEKWLRPIVESRYTDGTAFEAELKHLRAIAAELDRLRTENASLRAVAEAARESRRWICDEASWGEHKIADEKLARALAELASGKAGT